MATRRFSEAARFGSRGVMGRIAETNRNVRTTLFGIVIVVGVLVALLVTRGQRVAEWAPLDVVTSREPLQELPIRTSQETGVVRPAHTYDAVLDLSRISNLVVGVDLDHVAPGPARHDAVIRDETGAELFRDEIAAHYFADGRFMLRLFGSRLAAGDYWLEIEASGGGEEPRVIAASWFEVLR